MAVLQCLLLLCSCSTQLEPGEQLFTGLKPIEYSDYESNEHFDLTRTELEAALATAPNGALFGSSYYRTPFPYGLWIYNGFHDSESMVGKWLTSTFGSEPVLLSNVNPELRVSVARNVMQNNGYFRGTVDYDVIYSKFRTTPHDTVPRPRKAKIKYKARMGELFTLDSISYPNFPDDAYDMNFMQLSLLHKGDPFSISTLDDERNRLYNFFRNRGYYYYQQSYTSFLADTLSSPGKVQLQLRLMDSIPDNAMMPWVIGNTMVNIRRQYSEQLTDSVNRRSLTIVHGGKHSPIRPRVILQDVQMRHGQLFSQEAYEESMNRLATKGIYSSVGIDFTPRPLEEGQEVGILDMTVNCILDKPYDLTLQANYLGKTSGRMGPGASLGFSKRNAFRGGELLSANIAANYEFQYGGSQSGANSYEYSGDISLAMPRLHLPGWIVNKRRRWEITPSTIISIARETINRSGFFRRHITSAELSYTFQPTKQSRHQISPVILEYDRLADLSDSYNSIIQNSPILLSSLEDYYLQKMRYTYTYSSPMKYRNPILWTVTVSESSNLLALGYMAFGQDWNRKNKKAFNTPFAQFVKVETDFRKIWHTSETSTLVAHAQAGFIKTFGNSVTAPFSEYFYIGGANSLRAFSARSLGPGRYHNPNPKYSYITNIGDFKFCANLEYRPRLFGSLYGALFIDAGNIWNFKNEDYGTNDTEQESYLNTLIGDPAEGIFHLRNLPQDMAVGVGIGLRYDLDFFVLRIDWAFAIHTPYDTGRSGYLNTPSLSKGQCLNFAIGYPF